MHWIIMLIGLGTVSIGLFIIQAIISVLKIFLGPKVAKHASDVHSASASAHNPSRDEALVAVISAAIAAASGTTPASFRIASIQAAPVSGAPSSFNTPSWGYVERLTRLAGSR
ncbi:MAG TPA: OadG family transporter subunit [Spirochaetales bacterium]|nr:OadG family transporter subunit [Spirochaetales bacterium]